MLLSSPEALGNRDHASSLDCDVGIPLVWLRIVRSFDGHAAFLRARERAGREHVDMLPGGDCFLKGFLRLEVWANVHDILQRIEF
jgi:hypothetical protein